MFNFFKNKLKVIDLSDNDLQNYSIILNKILHVLQNANLIPQANVVLNLINLIQLKNNEEFKKCINGINMWGGSGAVWEVYIQDKNEAQKFEENMVKLINLMESTKILGSGIKPIKKIFLSNLSRYEE